MTKNPPKRTFRKKNKMYIPQTLYCPYCGGKAILRPVSYLFGDEVNPGSSDRRAAGADFALRFLNMRKCSAAAIKYPMRKT